MTSRIAAVGVGRLLLPLVVLVTSQVPTSAQTELLRFGPDGGPVPLQAYGISMARIGDVDGDGHADFIVGSRSTVRGVRAAGGYRVVSGRDGSTLREVLADQTEWLGFAVEGVGDLDGDGVPDYLVGAPAFDLDRGRAMLHSGATGALLHTWTGAERGMMMGGSLAVTRDSDGDGVLDLVVGPANSGSVELHSGRDRALVRSFSLPSVAVTDVADAGDVNADGLGDLVIRDLLPQNWAGMVEVRSGLDGSVLHVFRGRADRDFLGRSVAGAGDVDNDGFDDVILGAKGRAEVRSGRTGGLLFEFVEPVVGGEFGGAVCGPGDVDGDGFDDVAVGASYEFDGTGAVYVYSGADGRLLRALRGTRFSYFGREVEPAGDVDGDGLADIMVSAWLEYSRTTLDAYGFVRVFSLGLGGRPGVVTRVGSACDNRRGFAPRIGWRGAPVLGRRFEVFVQGAGVGAVGVLRIGLPTDDPLDGLGAPGCRSRVRLPEFDHFVVTGAQGQATSSGVRLPVDTRLLGVELAAQWVLADGSNALGISVSDALALRVGG